LIGISAGRHRFLAFESEGVMKSFSGIATLSFGLVLLVGCASTKTAYRDVPSQQQSAGSTIEVDERYVTLVENIAKQRGTRVMWVNKPVKRMNAVAAAH
jgi:hypothetical protein